ncbi:YchF/TatD family DNA exonuclease [Candidatus Poribacteria bacterium]|nr:YchF/TatD family DNA exonuclease [Candidatus Poribacteria bacterium]
MLFDTHVHLDDERYNSDRESVIENAIKENVNLLINVGVNKESSLFSVKLAEKYDFIYAACGIHPHDADKATDDEYNAIAELLSHKKVIAVGEIGLDYYRNLSPKDKQQKVFIKLIQMAKENKKPVIIHSRDAENDTMRILEKEVSGLNKGVAHCFSGSLEMAKKLISMDFYISFSGQVTFKNAANLVKLIEQIPIERILVETDCPYLSPEPHRGDKNVPSYVKYVAIKIAEIKSLSFEDVARITTVNAINLFNLPVTINPTIAYPIRDSLYLNITNRCSNDCSFCIRTKQDIVKGHFLRLKSEPTVEEVLQSVLPVVEKYREVVFCGYGEPTIRTDDMLKIANALKDKGVRHIRLNTNGQGNLICKKNIVPKFLDTIDEICISLNAADKETYIKICQPAFGEDTYNSVLNFIQECKKVVPKVILTFVELPGLDLQACRDLANKLQVGYKIRKYDVVG